MGAGGHHGARSGVRERIAGRRENPAGESSGVGGEEGGCESYRVAENPEGDCQGVQGGVKSLQGIDTPGVTYLPQGDKTPGVATEGEGVLGEYGLGQGGDGTTPTTRETRACMTSGGE